MLDFTQTAAHGRPRVMGVLNVTPDSFSDGGVGFENGCVALDHVLRLSENMVGEGVDVLDVGGESTRPGALAVGESEELDRVMPVIEALVSHFDIPVSVDTSNPALISQAVAAGVVLVNDVRALTRPGALSAVLASDASVCLMHMQGQPSTMQEAPVYRDVVAEVQGFLLDRVGVCTKAGISENRIILDPGFGFGKELAHNIALMGGLPRFVKMGFPVLVGLSRKRMIGDITGRPVAERVHGSVALAMLAAQRGVAMLRVHDVGPTVDAFKILAELGEFPNQDLLKCASEN